VISALVNLRVAPAVARSAVVCAAKTPPQEFEPLFRKAMELIQ